VRRHTESAKKFPSHSEWRAERRVTPLQHYRYTMTRNWRGVMDLNHRPPGLLCPAHLHRADSPKLLLVSEPIKLFYRFYSMTVSTPNITLLNFLQYSFPTVSMKHSPFCQAPLCGQTLKLLHHHYHNPDNVLISESQASVGDFSLPDHH
jgi:hypothetical protein